MNVKQVIVVRKDLSMRRGKEIAQGCHSSISFLTKRMKNVDSKGRTEIKLSSAEIEWIESGFAKICVRVNSEEELIEIYKKAIAAGLECHLIIDSGKTEFDGVPTKTCLAIGPDESHKIDKVTGDLQLY
jgi:PTH2 family peptidyl-tRNA hydrolase